MAVIFLAHNGIGTGHLSRSLELCNHLIKHQLKPLLLYQTPGIHFAADEIIKLNIRNINKAEYEYRSKIEDAINSYCLLDDFAVFIEDTHPSNLELNDKILKILIVRPTDFDYLTYLKKNYSDYYDFFLIADNSDSPTWPYEVDQTTQILSWENWKQIDPIFKNRSGEVGTIDIVREKYAIRTDSLVYVFSMGGGGQHSQTEDVGAFIKTSRLICKKIILKYPQARFLFVKGPLFPQGEPIPEEFEQVDFEPNMATLLSIATAAIIRPGFNTIWECIKGGTPFRVIKGTNYLEPSDKRLQKLIDLKIASENDDIFFSTDWDKMYSELERINKVWHGSPNKSLLACLSYSNNIIPDEAVVKKCVLIISSGVQQRNFEKLTRDFSDYELKFLSAKRNSGIFTGTLDTIFSVINTDEILGLTELDDYIDNYDPEVIIYINLPGIITETLNVFRRIFKNKHSLKFEIGPNSTGDVTKELSPIFAAYSTDKTDYYLEKFIEMSGRQLFGKNVFIRVDDVINLNSEIDFIVSLCMDYGYSTSLEVIPYLSKFNEDLLNHYDKSFEKLIVAQHGYTHFINPMNRKPVRSEFGFTMYPNDLELNNIKSGKEILQKNFPERFKNGFSAPYDCIPPWFSAVWEDLNGSYISTIKRYENHSGLPLLKAKVDWWNWEKKKSYNIETILNNTLISAANQNYVGLVLHPKHFENASSKNKLIKIFDGMKRGGYESPLISTYLTSQKNQVTTIINRAYDI